MARVPVPPGYDSWNDYIKTVAGNDKAARRNIKLGQEAQIERHYPAPSYREYNIYVAPGTVAPAVGRPWYPSAAGLFRSQYSGYFADDVNWFDSRTAAATAVVSSLGIPSISANTSYQYLGYYLASTTETYTFYLTSDDASYMWIGEDAVSGYTIANSTVNNGGSHGTVETSGTAALTSGQIYPIRIQVGNGGGPGTLTVNYSTPTIAKTTVFTNLVSYNIETNGF